VCKIRVRVFFDMRRLLLTKIDEVLPLLIKIFKTNFLTQVGKKDFEFENFNFLFLKEYEGIERHTIFFCFAG